MRGFLGATLDLRRPRLLYVLLVLPEAGEQFGGETRALFDVESQRFLEDLLRCFSHVESVPVGHVAYTERCLCNIVRTVARKFVARVG